MEEDDWERGIDDGEEETDQKDIAPEDSGNDDSRASRKGAEVARGIRKRL
jgi:hypothetical protein